MLYSVGSHFLFSTGDSSGNHTIVLAILLGWLLFGETITMPALACIFLVVAGAILNTLYKNR